MRTQLRRQLDWPLLIATVLLLVVGLLALWSASSIQKDHADFRSQVAGIALGLPVLLLFFLVDPRVWGHYSKAIYVAMLAFLVLVWVPGLGRSGGGAERWVTMGPVGLQPSEIAKLLVTLTLADHLVRHGTRLKSLSGLLSSLLHILPPFVLVAAQPSLSTSLVFLVIWAGVSIVAGQRLKYLVVMGIVGLVAFGIAWKSGFIRPYQKERVVQYMSGDLGYHTERSLTSVGSGRLVGEGIGRGPLKEAKYVPEATTDFIFAVVAEEGGFVGSMLVIALYGFFLWRIWLIVVYAQVEYFRLIAAGIFTVFSFHALVNFFVVLGIFPVTGVPLPFISFGRTAMLLSLASVGLLLNIRGREKHLVF
ncbi:MAG: FtsW/RodA/SpoVE family cell cycle protein [Armatimonadetes bacterium]|nr:FtsW/RodA/SpoVE family cell cycle protein [Armatimonadota bacterium]